MREKKLREIQDMAVTIRELASPGMSPKELVDAVRQRYPNATKKEVARAAFMSVIHSADHDPKVHAGTTRSGYRDARQLTLPAPSNNLLIS
jgi:hypothetical protein